MIKGSLVALVTPMLGDGRIDFDNLKKLVDFHVEAGTDAIVSVGTTGESSTLDIDEQVEVVRKTVEFADRRIPVIAGSGGNATSEALDLTHKMRALDVAACLLVVPYYNKPTQEGIYQHFKYIAKRVDVPQILYNVPGRTGVDMHNDTVVRLSRLDNIVGIKDASADLSRVPKLRAHCGSDFSLYSGDDGTTLDFIQQGGDGCISVTANIAPSKMHQMCVEAISGNYRIADRLNRELDGLHQGLFVESNPIPVKWALSRLGYCDNGIRLPMTWLPQKFHSVLEAAMVESGVLVTE